MVSKSNQDKRMADRLLNKIKFKNNV